MPMRIASAASGTTTWLAGVEKTGASVGSRHLLSDGCWERADGSLPFPCVATELRGDTTRNFQLWVVSPTSGSSK